MAENKSSNRKDTVKKPRRRKWLIVTGVILALIVLLVAIAPSLLCTGPGLRLIVGQINSRIAGKVKIGSLSIGWFSPLTINHLTVMDPEGSAVVKNAAVHTQVSLVGLISNWHHLGKIDIPISSLHLATVNGKLNLLQAIASSAPAAKSSSAVTPPAKVPTTPAAASSPTVPALSGSIDLTVQNLTWITPGKPALRATGLHFAATFNTRSLKPSMATFSVAAGLGSAAPAKIVLKLQAAAFGPRGMLPVEKMTGTVSVNTQGLELACLNPLLAGDGMHLQSSGILSLNAQADMKSHAALGIKLSLVADHVHLRGAMLKGDHPDLGNVDVRTAAAVDYAGASPRYQVSQFSLASSKLGSVSVTGSGSIQTLLAIIHNHDQQPIGKAQLAIKLKSVISRVLEQFPHLLRTPSGAKFTGGALAFSAAVAAGDGHHLAPQSASSRTPLLPPVSFDIKSRLSTLKWTLPSHESARSAYGDLKLSGATTGGPVTIALSAFAGGGAEKPSTVTLNGTISPFAHQRLKALPAMTGNMTLNMSHVYLSYLKRFNLPVNTDGTLHGHLAVVSNAPHQGRISGQMQIDALTLGGALLHGDHPVLGNLIIPVDMVWDAEHLNIEQLAMQCPAFNISASGAVNLNRLSALRSTDGNWGGTGLAMTSTINTALFTDDFRHTLRLNHLPFKIKSGRAVVQLHLHSRGTTSALVLDLSLSPQVCRWKEIPASIYPMVMNASATRQAGRWTLTQCGISQSEPKSTSAVWRLSLLSAHGAKELSYSLASDWNLGLLKKEISPFVELDGKSITGRLSIAGKLNHVLTSKPAADIKLQLRHLVYLSEAKASPVRISTITLPLKADFLLTRGSLASAHFSMGMNSPQLLDVQAAAAITPQPLSIRHLHMTLAMMNLKKLWVLVRTISPSTPAYTLAGYIKNSPIDLNYSPGRLEVTDAALHLSDISMQGGVKNAPPFIEPKLDLLMAADIHTGKVRSVTLSDMSVKSGDKLLMVTIDKPVMVNLAGSSPQIAAPSIKVAADLARLQNLLINLGKLPVGAKLAGQMALDAAALGNGKVITTTLTAHVNGYQVAMPGAKAVLPPTNLLASLAGQADLTKKIFTVTHTCHIGETGGKKSGGNLLTIERESVLAWGPGGVEKIHGTLHYDLAGAIALLKPFLPPTLSATGSGSMPLAVTGPLTSAPGLLIARKLTITSTALAFKELSYDGTHLGPGSLGFSESAGRIEITPAAIPANHGTVNLGGYIDLNGATPTYVLPSPLQVASNVQINAPMGASILKFLPLTWGNKGQPALVNVQGLLNMSLHSADIPLSSVAMKKSGTAVGTVSITHLTTNAPFVGQVSALSGPLGGNISIADSGIRPTQFVLKNGRVSYNNMKLVLASFGLDLSGWVGLNNQMNVDMNITGGGLTLPIPLKLAGTTASPQIKLTSHPLKSIGKGIKGQVKGLLHGLFGQ
ncbi:MAG: hypothetical protein ACP5O1_00780 [Phycisphaerae bacterium]